MFALVVAFAAVPFVNISGSAASSKEDNISKTLGFNTSGEDAFYKFRVPGGGMDCEGKIRYYFQDGRQITTLKPSGSRCYAVSMKVDYGTGYPGWTTGYNGSSVGLNTTDTAHIENILYRLCSLPVGSRQAVCTKVLRTRTPDWTLGRCYETKPLITVTSNQTHACVRYIQDALKQDGYRPGQVDGIYGPNTEAAVKRFQADSRHSPVLTADGKFGPQTWSKFINTYGYFTE